MYQGMHLQGSVCLMGLHSLQGQAAMVGSSVRPPNVAQKFCSFIGKFVFLTVQALTAVLIWKKMQKLTCSGWNSEIWACYANNSITPRELYLTNSQTMWERLSIAIFFGLANGNVDNFQIPSFHTPLDMAPGSDFHGTLTCSARVAKLDSLNSCCCWGRWFFVPFEKASEMRDFPWEFSYKIRKSQQIQMDLAPFGRFGIEEKRCEMPMQNHGVQKCLNYSTWPFTLGAPKRSEEFFILLTDDLSWPGIQHHSPTKAPVA